MSLEGMNSVIGQMQMQAKQIAYASLNNSPAYFNRTAETGAFSNVLSASLDKISAMQTESRSQAERFVTGDTDMELSDVMVSLQKSSMAFKFGTQVRNKMVSAYQEIMSMAI